MKTLEQHRADLLAKYGHEHKQTFGSGGFVFLDDIMGCDADVARIARTSYGAGTKTLNDDTALIRRLIKDWHTSPFEMAKIRFFVRAPIDLVRQLVRHRMLVHGNINEYSTRYSVAVDDMATVEPTQWRKQSTSNKQGSDGFVTDWTFKPMDAYRNLSPGTYLTHRQNELQELATEIYKERLELGVAREQARMDLPLSNYTELYFTADLHNLLHFLSLRLDPHAQQEIRELAECIAHVVQEWVPVTYQAFLDYRVNAVTFSTQESALLGSLLNGTPCLANEFIELSMDSRATILKQYGISSLNERAGFVKKLQNLIGWVEQPRTEGPFA